MSRKTNRDHAKKKQRPMVEDQVIAEHLTNLLTPAMKSQSSFFREFYHFQFWQQLIDQGIDFITRIKLNAAIEYQKVFTDSYSLRDRLIKIILSVEDLWSDFKT